MTEVPHTPETNISHQCDTVLRACEGLLGAIYGQSGQLGSATRQPRALVGLLSVTWSQAFIKPSISAQPLVFSALYKATQGCVDAVFLPPQMTFSLIGEIRVTLKKHGKTTNIDNCGADSKHSGFIQRVLLLGHY